MNFRLGTDSAEMNNVTQIIDITKEEARVLISALRDDKLIDCAKVNELSSDLIEQLQRFLLTMDNK